MAGALELGVASRANLYLIKHENSLVNTITGETWAPGLTSAALVQATCDILEAVIDKIPKGRAVFLLTSGVQSPNLILIVGSLKLTTVSI